MRHLFLSVCAAAFLLSTVSLQAQEVPAAPATTESSASVSDSGPAAQQQPTAAPEQAPPTGEPAVPATTKQFYKSVDAQGKVIFTDVPPANRPSEPIKLQSTNTLSMGVDAGEASATEAKAKPVQYNVTIVSPTNNEFMGQDVEAVTLSAQLDIGLQKGHTFQLYYDGKPVGNGETSYTVTELYRGTHTVEAKVFDQKKKLLGQATPVQFHVKRISKLNNQTAALLSGKSDTKKNPNGPSSGVGAPVDAGSTGKGGASSSSGANGANGAGGPSGASSSKGAGGTSK